MFPCQHLVVQLVEMSIVFVSAEVVLVSCDWVTDDPHYGLVVQSEHDNVDIQCPLNGAASVSEDGEEVQWVEWYKDDERLAEWHHTHEVSYRLLPRYGVSVIPPPRGTTATLSISAVDSAADSGTYFCRVGTNAHILISDTFTLLVLRERIDDITITYTKLRDGDTSDSFQVMCNARGYPLPSIQWMVRAGRSGAEVPAVEAEDKVEERTLRVMSSMSNVTVTGDMDSVTLVCRATSESLSPSGNSTRIHWREAKVRLTATYLPISRVVQINAGRPLYKISDGEDVTVTCEAASRPPISAVVWRRHRAGFVTSLDIDEVKYSERSVSGDLVRLVISNVSEDDEGNYTCTGVNSVGVGLASPGGFVLEVADASDGGSGEELVGTSGGSSSYQAMMYPWSGVLMTVIIALLNVFMGVTSVGVTWWRRSLLLRGRGRIEQLETAVTDQMEGTVVG